MKKALIPVVLFALVLSLAAAAGCGSKTTTVTTPDGSVKVEEGEDGKVTITDETGQSTYESKTGAPSEAELGVAIYPGAKYSTDSGGAITSDGTSTVVAEFTTTDSAEKVVGFYTGKLGEPMVNMGNEAIWTINKNQTENITVSVASDGAKTTIGILHIITGK